MNKVLQGISKVGVFKVTRYESGNLTHSFTTIAPKAYLTKIGVLALFQIGYNRTKPNRNWSFDAITNYDIIEYSDRFMHIRHGGSENCRYYAQLL